MQMWLFNAAQLITPDTDPKPLLLSFAITLHDFVFLASI